MVNMVNALGGGLFMRNGSYLVTLTLSQARVSERSLRAVEIIAQGSMAYVSAWITTPVAEKHMLWFEYEMSL